MGYYSDEFWDAIISQLNDNSGVTRHFHLVGQVGAKIQFGGGAKKVTSARGGAGPPCPPSGYATGDKGLQLRPLSHSRALAIIKGRLEIVTSHLLKQVGVFLFNLPWKILFCWKPLLLKKKNL